MATGTGPSATCEARTLKGFSWFSGCSRMLASGCNGALVLKKCNNNK